MRLAILFLAAATLLVTIAAAPTPERSKTPLNIPTPQNLRDRFYMDGIQKGSSDDLMIRAEYKRSVENYVHESDGLIVEKTNFKRRRLRAVYGPGELPPHIKARAEKAIIEWTQSGIHELITRRKLEQWRRLEETERTTDAKIVKKKAALERIEELQCQIQNALETCQTQVEDLKEEIRFLENQRRAARVMLGELHWGDLVDEGYGDDDLFDDDPTDDVFKQVSTGLGQAATHARSRVSNGINTLTKAVVRGSEMGNGRRPGGLAGNGGFHLPVPVPGKVLGF